MHQVSGPAAPSDSATKRSKDLKDLEKEFGSSGSRRNEGEAANYGIYYDDSEYDYMQHLRALGSGEGDAQFIDASVKGRGKAKATKLEDALREQLPGNLEDGDDMGSTASSYVRQKTYQDQQDIPDELAGFKPDMDPRLREALEALEDEEFVDEEGEDDTFGALVEEGQEMDPSEWRDTYIEDDDDGWESDATEKAPVQYESTSKKASELATNPSEPQNTALSDLPSHDEPIPDATPTDSDWMKEFAKYKKDIKSKQMPGGPGDNSAQLRSGMSTQFTEGGTPVRKKKRKGALTNPSSHSMSSSALARTEGHRLLDDRFERIEALYSLDEEGEELDDSSLADGMSAASGASRFSRVSQTPSHASQDDNVALPSNFDNVMDEFLGGWQDSGASAKRKGAKAKRGKNGNEAVGIKMLDDVRQELGPAKVQGSV